MDISKTGEFEIRLTKSEHALGPWRVFGLLNIMGELDNIPNIVYRLIANIFNLFGFGCHDGRA